MATKLSDYDTLLLEFKPRPIRTERDHAHGNTEDRDKSVTLHEAECDHDQGRNGQKIAKGDRQSHRDGEEHQRGVDHPHQEDVRVRGVGLAAAREDAQRQAKRNESRLATLP
mgnify:CR=1 FL=1